MVVAVVGSGGVRLVVDFNEEDALVRGAFFGACLPFFLAAKTVVLVLEITAYQNERSGRPSTRRQVSRATISDSVDEWETTVCFLHMALRGKKVFGPTKAAKIPVVDLELCTQSANEASVKIMIANLSAGSPIQPCKQCVRVE